MKTIHIISASDSSGGAGMQRDVMTARDHGFHPICSLTGITVQNGERVLRVEDIREDLLQEQLECSRNFSVDCVKIGAVFSLSSLKLVRDYILREKPSLIICDPVFKPTGGDDFYKTEMIAFFVEEIIPLLDLLTPNRRELETICNRKFNTIKDAAAYILNNKFLCPVFITGGHFAFSSDRILEVLVDKEIRYISKKYEGFGYTHGTGCTFSTAAACNAAEGSSILECCKKASAYVSALYKKY